MLYTKIKCPAGLKSIILGLLLVWVPHLCKDDLFYVVLCTQLKWLGTTARDYILVNSMAAELVNSLINDLWHSNRKKMLNGIFILGCKIPYLLANHKCCMHQIENGSSAYQSLWSRPEHFNPTSLHDAIVMLAGSILLTRGNTIFCPLRRKWRCAEMLQELSLVAPVVRSCCAYWSLWLQPYPEF